MNYHLKPIIEYNDKIFNALFPHLKAHEVFKRFVDNMQNNTEESEYMDWSRDFYEDTNEVK